MSDPRRPSPEVIALIENHAEMVRDTMRAIRGDMDDPGDFYYDEDRARTALESHIAGLEQVKSVFGLYIDSWNHDAVAFCGDCGSPCTVVRPGKTQCDSCDNERALRSALQAVVGAWDNAKLDRVHANLSDAITAARSLLSRDTTKNE